MEQRRRGLKLSEDTAKAVDAEVLKIIDESHDEAKRLLTQHRRQRARPLETTKLPAGSRAQIA
jgi:ATP-dependent Zn protease